MPWKRTVKVCKGKTRKGRKSINKIYFMFDVTLENCCAVHSLKYCIYKIIFDFKRSVNIYNSDHGAFSLIEVPLQSKAHEVLFCLGFSMNEVK